MAVATEPEARHGQQSLFWPPFLLHHVPDKPFACMAGDGDVQPLTSTAPFLCAAEGQKLARVDTVIHPIDLGRVGFCGYLKI